MREAKPRAFFCFRGYPVRQALPHGQRQSRLPSGQSRPLRFSFAFASGRSPSGLLWPGWRSLLLALPLRLRLRLQLRLLALRRSQLRLVAFHLLHRLRSYGLTHRHQNLTLSRRRRHLTLVFSLLLLLLFDLLSALPSRLLICNSHGSPFQEA